MRWSQAFIPTRREAPAEASFTSHKILLRGGFARQLASGVFSILPLGERVRRKIVRIVEEEMDAIGGQRFHLPALHPAEIWQQSGRWSVMGANMFRLRDRHGVDLGLGMTHEEVFASIAADEIRSYRQLPQIWYQIQTKFRDEERPKAGLLRVREFTMKDSYSFDASEEGLGASFDRHHDAYRRIFARCGIDFVAVEASSGAMGGSRSVEFMVKTEAGEDLIATCAACGYAANTEKAVSRVEPLADEDGGPEPVRIPTPGIRTIDELARLAPGFEATRQIKTLVYFAGDEMLLALLRGDHDLQPAKLADGLGVSEVRPAHESEIRTALGAGPGSLGAVGVTSIRVVADPALRGRKNMVTGANEDDWHVKGVDVERDVAVRDWLDLRLVRSGEKCAKCDDGTIEVFKAVEIGHIFKLGTRYSEAFGATVLGPEGDETPVVMGSYGIGVERVIVSALELLADERGAVWPVSIAPYEVVVTPINLKDAAVASAAERLVGDLEARGVEVLYDDRDERAGVKFNDAELVGIPVRLVVGAKKLASGKVEMSERRSGSSEDLALETAAERVADFVRARRHGARRDGD